MKLIDVMGLEYTRSKRWLNATLGLAFLIQVMALGSIFMGAGERQKALGLLAALAQFGLFISRRKSRSHFGLAEEIRRIAMLQDGLGIHPSEDQIASMHERVGDPAAAKPLYDGSYYESTTAIGDKRLAEITRESSFWTSALAGTSSAIFWLMSGLGFALSIILFIVTVQAGAPQPVLDTAARAVLVGMTFWLTGDLANMALQFQSLAKTAGRIQSQCSALLSKGGDIKDAVHIAAAEYNCALVQAPPIPEPIYKWRQAALNEAWSKRKTAVG